MNQFATCPKPMPADGLRCLSPREAQQRARALACVRDNQSTQCQGQVYVNIFFDGTGNNRDWQKPGSSSTQLAINGHSNVARLYDAAFDEPVSGLFSYYIPGVGTPFKQIGDDGQSLLGASAAKFGADRINWGITRIYNAMHAYLTNADLIKDEEARTIVNNMSSLVAQLGFENAMRRTILKTWESKLAAVVKAHQRKLLQVNVAVFGFSRGSAEARAFANWLFEIAMGEGGGYQLAGVPLRLYFMGLFDTVASVGSTSMLPGGEGKMAWADDKGMSVHPAVEQCVHFIALHEQRVNFPLDVTSSGKQITYPGMHSDVGGGYTPGSQGKAFVDKATNDGAKLSQIPLIDMHFEALKAGVPLQTIGEIEATPFARSFARDPSLISAYNAWLQGHGQPTNGSARVLARAHTRQYLRWRGLRLHEATSLLEQPFFQRAPTEDKVDLAEGQKHFATLVARIRRQEERSRFYKEPVFSIPGLIDVRRSSQPVDTPDDDPALLRVIGPDTRELHGQLKEEPPPPPVVHLFDNYMHDSLAGFRMPEKTGKQELAFPALATNGYLRYRTIFENG